jgi:hypothetical protein
VPEALGEVDLEEEASDSSKIMAGEITIITEEILDGGIIITAGGENKS